MVEDTRHTNLELHPAAGPLALIALSLNLAGCATASCAEIHSDLRDRVEARRRALERLPPDTDKAKTYRAEIDLHVARDDLDRHERRAEVCNLPRAGGDCEAYIPSFGFDPHSQTCVPFIYGGCGGNDNRFRSLAECEATCACRRDDR